MPADRIKDKLTKTQAESRFNSISQGIQYRMFFNFNLGDSYSGLNQINFTPTGEDIFLDYRGDEVTAVWLNSEQIPIEKIQSWRKGGKIFFPSGVFKLGEENVLQLGFQNRYYTDGDGIHTYTDNENKQYLYTQTEPYEANRILPLFDQPDLKARYEVFAACPSDWLIITSEIEKFSSTFENFLSKEFLKEDASLNFLQKIKTDFGTEIASDKKFYRFNNTFPLSTYLNNIIAGPYAKYTCPKEKLYREIPMSVYCRQNLKEFVEAQLETIFEPHSLGIEFYEKFYSFDYPFSKCDVIFCPEYTVGAMEYPGSITYSEARYLYRKKEISKSERSNRARVIWHELAHMWFGNAVTMKWWSDLWLNESFADFACFQAWGKLLDSASFKLAHPSLFFISRKSWAFLQDQEPTTHPVACQVSDTEEALSIFDGITYPKGAMCMTQLLHLIGEKKFGLALGKYFQKHAWGNTLLQDLLDVCIEAVGDEIPHPSLDIAAWKEDWLVNPGLNEVQPEWDSAATAAESKVVVRQTAAREDFPTLRYHKIKIAFYKEDGEIFEDREFLLEKGETTEIVYNAENGIKAVLLNSGDLSYIKVILDKTSLEYFKTNFYKIDSVTNQAIIARAVFDQLRDARMSSEEYFNWMIPIYEHEQTSEMAHFLSPYLNGALSSYTPSSNYAAIAHKLFEITLAKLEKTQDFDEIATLKSNLFSFAYGEADIETLVSMKGVPFGHANKAFSNGEKWRIVYLMHVGSKFGEEERKQAFEALWEEDKTDTKTQYKLKIEGLTANAEKREELFESYLDGTKMSYKHMEYSITGFASKFVPLEVRKSYFDRYFENWAEIQRTKSAMVKKTFSIYLFPKTDDKKYLLKKLDEVLSGVDKEKETVMTKWLLQKKDGIERAARVIGVDLK